MFRKSIPMVALAALFAVTLAYAQEGSTTTSGSAPAATAPATTPAPAKAPAKSTKSSSAHHSSAKIDLNSASKEQLMTLKGVGDATADKIIAARPFKSKSELTSKGIVTKKEYEAISAHVIAHQEAAAKPAATK